VGWLRGDEDALAAILWTSAALVLASPAFAIDATPSARSPAQVPRDAWTLDQTVTSHVHQSGGAGLGHRHRQRLGQASSTAQRMNIAIDDTKVGWDVARARPTTNRRSTWPAGTQLHPHGILHAPSPAGLVINSLGRRGATVLNRTPMPTLGGGEHLHRQLPQGSATITCRRSAIGIAGGGEAQTNAFTSGYRFRADSPTCWRAIPLPAVTRRDSNRRCRQPLQPPDARERRKVEFQRGSERRADDGVVDRSSTTPALTE